MWLVEVSLQSVVALEPAILRSLPARCCFVRLLPDEKELCCEPRNDANGTTASAHSISKDNSRWQSRALLRQGTAVSFPPVPGFDALYIMTTAMQGSATCLFWSFMSLGWTKIS